MPKNRRETPCPRPSDDIALASRRGWIHDACVEARGQRLPTQEEASADFALSQVRGGLQGLAQCASVGGVMVAPESVREIISEAAAM